ncbi:hypothetical protein [Spiroplasma citri]|uniref:Hypothetical transmembrane protein n=1 Tax=Spiroplasma citri TaxID=2133 RepID=Q14N83_SPICI|nr:hypothetical protein [Spiroplasma citri]APE74887.1 hypothetical protein SCITRI_001002 [Spiroplasma citri]QED24802.1 hypothetical protein FRX96_05115 [Spiroplasma citri]QIA67156.1 hypothetical protein GMI18_05575 [Spiroplasma citri]QIA69063.1 hypothetical protein GL298_05815 [Spiroplasma citri]QIA70929.1 hypothetical protein GL981_05870 [Spiroplasma citri]
MTNEQKTEQDTSIKIKNSWLINEKINLSALYRFFLSYLRRQKMVLIFSVVLIPIAILCQAIFVNYRQGSNVIALSIGVTFIATGTSVAVYMLMGFLIDLKMSVVYKRIGLLEIKPLGFVLIVYAYCFTLVIIADLLVLITSFIINAVLKINFAVAYNLIVLLFFIISIFISAFAIALMIIAVILINSRTMQSIVTTILTILFVGGSFLFVAFIPALVGTHYKEAILSIKGLSISCGVMLGSLVLTSLLIWLIIRIFRWDN